MKSLAFIFVLSLLFSSEASAMRCGNKLVRVGDYVYKLKKLCGEPEAVIREGNATVYIYEKNGRENKITVKNQKIWQED